MEKIEIVDFGGVVVCECSGKRNPDGSVELPNCRFNDLRCVSFTGKKFVGCVFHGQFLGCRFENCVFERCHFENGFFSTVLLNHCVFELCDFDEFKFQMGCLASVNFNECRMNEDVIDVKKCVMDNVVWNE